MDKPDWATRLQRTFARKYDAGFAKGLMLGKAVATRDEQERIIKSLEEQMASMKEVAIEPFNDAVIGYMKAIEHSLRRIKEEN